MGGEDCGQNPEIVWMIGGAAIAGLGLLGLVIRSSAGDTPAAQPSNVADELRKSADLHASGALDDEEYAALKKRLLN